MCVVSMVHDDYNKRPWPWTTPQPFTPIQPTILPWVQPVETKPVDWTKFLKDIGTDEKDKEIARLKKQIEDYKKALDAAKVVDTLTKQPDCEDPEKAKLLARVEELEKLLKGIRKAVRTPRKKKLTSRKK